MKIPQRTLLLWSAFAALLVAAVFAPLYTGADAAPSRRAGEYASSTGVRLNFPAVPALGQPAFSGKLGTARVGAETANASADYANDPDGVGRYVTVANPSGSVSGDASVKAWEAVSDPNVLTVSLVPGGPVVLDVPTMHTQARCQLPHAPQTQNFVTAPTFAGQPISKGANKIRTTGAKLGYPGVADADLTVTMTQVQEVTPNTAAEARVVITIEGDLYDSSGAKVHSGPLGEIVLGDVRVVCEGEPTPTPTPAAGKLIVDKRVDKTVVKVGGKVTYTLVATNIGESPLTPARFVDDMSDVLRHGDYNDDAQATKGRVRFDPPDLRWRGRLDPGESATITFSVTARRIGIMRNVVVWNKPPKPDPTPKPKPPKPKPKPKPKPTGKDETRTRVVPRHQK